MNWKISIEKIDNGYVLTKFNNEDDKGNPVPYSKVIEIPEEEEETLNDVSEKNLDLLWDIAEYFSFIPGKHNEKELIIELRKRGEDND